MVFTEKKVSGLTRKPAGQGMYLLLLLMMLFALSLVTGSCAPAETSPSSVITSTAATPGKTDVNAPYADGFYPSPGSSGIERDVIISLHIKDNGAGVNKDSVKIYVRNSPVDAAVTGDKSDYKLEYKPPGKFDFAERIDVSVEAADLASPPNRYKYEYSFNIMWNTPPEIEEIGDKDVYQNELLQFTVKAHDKDGDTLDYSADGLPEGADFDLTSLVFSWIPESTGIFSMNFSANDSRLSVSKSVRINVRPERPIKLNVVFYGVHNPGVENSIVKVRPEYITVNTSHGLWGEIYGYDTGWLVRDVSKYREAGIKVISYITAGYEGAGSGSGMEKRWYTLEMNKKLIKNIAENDRADGVFIDECSSFPNAGGKAYLKELTDYAHSFGLIVWGNAGESNFDPWFFTGGGFDFMHSVEQWHGQKLSGIQTKWSQRISVTGYQPGYLIGDAVRLTLDAWEKGIGYCYICTSGYDSLPGWFEEYGRRLRASGRLPVED